MSNEKETFTYTFCECAENHVGMQQIGSKATVGLELSDLQAAAEDAKVLGCTPELIALHTTQTNQQDLPGIRANHAKVTDSRSLLVQAYVLVIRDGVRMFLSEKEKASLLVASQTANVDKQAWMRGRVVNKHARWNLCYDDKSQEPDYANQKGRIVDFKDVPNLAAVRDRLSCVFGLKAEKLKCELNHYYDVTKCGIGYHGDTERKIVIGLRLGASMPLVFQWFQQFVPMPNCPPVTITLNHGDMYCMSCKAVGWDWKQSSVPTLRHSAGGPKWTTWKPKPKPKPKKDKNTNNTNNDNNNNTNQQIPTEKAKKPKKRKRSSALPS